ncbi:MAG: ABC transporter permease [Candidatus Marinimicrobia bacterium]|nr:ABC transporter permease [Candidatus Neomarinimicrobiota bacterium]MCH7954645.1 ABC transporter permease [Candidatus Neomarinimicrobiota bacterium]
MMIFRLAIKNLLGAGMRTWLNVVVTSFSFTIIIFFNAMYNGMRQDTLRILLDTEVAGGQLWHPEYDPFDPLTIEDSHSIISEELQKMVAGNEAMPVLVRQATFYMNGRSSVGLMKGIPPGQEIVRMPLKVIGDYSGDYIPVVIGSGMSKKTGLRKGDLFTVRWLDALRTYDADEFEVAEVIKLDNYRLDRGVIWLSLEKMRELLQMPGEVTYIVLKRDHAFNNQADSFIYKDIEYFMKDIDSAIEADQVWARTIFGLLLIMASLGIFNSQVLSIFRRKKEIGTLMALGMTRQRIVRLFTLEGGLHSVLALFVGALYGTPLFYYLATRGITIPYGEEAGIISTGSLYPVFGPQLIFGTMLLVAGVVTVVSFLPARKIANMQPTEALRGKIS